jgi:DNA oxidative demethylase
MQAELFDEVPRERALAPGAMVLAQFAREQAGELLAAIDRVTATAPLRHMATPGGYAMSVAMTNCGAVGWTTDRTGYRYTATDPDSGSLWPAMPPLFASLASRAAAAAGFDDFAPDACLINRYVPGARMSLHQDRNELDRTAPIVSVSLGLPATFLWGGVTRAQRPTRVRLANGDVVVWGGPARLTFHGIAALADGRHGLTGAARFNLTFRRAR